jgi:poly-D-alanine transfer protein DltD
LKAKAADASFVILPLNPYYYANLDELDPVMQELAATVRKNGYSCLNFWATRSEEFEKGVLSDVMHLSDYGWYRVDRFIADTYNLQPPRHERP